MLVKSTPDIHKTSSEYRLNQFFFLAYNNNTMFLNLFIKL